MQVMKAGLNIQGRNLLLVTPAVSISKGQLRTFSELTHLGLATPPAIVMALHVTPQR